MKYFTNFLIFIGLSLLISLSACKKDDFDFKKVTTHMDWGPSYAIPICNGSLVIRDMLRHYDDDHLFGSYTDADRKDMLYVVYNQHVGSYDATTKFYMLPQAAGATVNGTDLPLSHFSHAGDTASFTKVVNETLNMIPSGSEIDSVIIKSATLDFGITSTFKHAGFVEVTFLNVKKNGIAYKKLIPINTSDGTFTYSGNYNDLAGYKLNMVPTAGIYNQLNVKYKVFLTYSAGATSADGAVTINVGLSTIKCASMFGYFGKNKILLASDSIEVKMFSEAFTGSFFYHSPRLNFQFKSSYGVPLNFYFKNFSSSSTITGITMPMTGTAIPSFLNPFLIKSSDIYTNYGKTIVDSLVFDRTNSNIREVIGTSPRYIVVDSLLAEVNPSTAHPHTNYVLESSAIDVDMRLELPLWGWANGIALQDTEKFDFPKYYYDFHGKVLRKALFRISSENYLPVEMGIQIYFMSYDSLKNKYEEVDVLMGEDKILVPAGITNADGRVVSASTKIKDIVVDAKKLANMNKRKVSHFIYRAFLNTENSAASKDVKFFNTDKISLHIGLQCDFGTNTLTIQNY